MNAEEALVTEDTSTGALKREYDLSVRRVEEAESTLKAAQDHRFAALQAWLKNPSCPVVEVECRYGHKEIRKVLPTGEVHRGLSCSEEEWNTGSMGPLRLPCSAPVQVIAGTLDLSHLRDGAVQEGLSSTVAQMEGEA